MKLEHGKHYRTRDGRRARVYATDAGGLYSVHGGLLSRGVWIHVCWTNEGRFASFGLNDADLVTEWTDLPEVDWSAMPAWAQWVAMDKNGDWWWFATEPATNDDIWIGGGGPHDEIPTSHAPRYSGDWKNSKYKRPESTKAVIGRLINEQESRP